MKTVTRFLLGNFKNRDLGLLVIRLGIGLSMLIFHGWGKITGGPEKWAGVGGSMANLGLDFAPTFWGFLAASAESVGSALLVMGLLFRPATLMLAFTMVIAVTVHLNMPPESPRAGWSGASHALELFAVYVGLLLTGPGKYRLGPKG